MTTRKRVLLDVDGVLADFLTPCLAIVNRMLGTSHTLAQMTSWDLFEALGITDKATINSVYAEMKRTGWCRALEVYPRALMGVGELQEVADVFITTSQMAGETHWVHERERWLQYHFAIDRHHVLHGDAKFLVAGDVFVDDKITNVHQGWAGARVGDWGALRTLVENHTPDRTWRPL